MAVVELKSVVGVNSSIVDTMSWQVARGDAESIRQLGKLSIVLVEAHWIRAHSEVTEGIALLVQAWRAACLRRAPKS
eukprot:2286374-Amphidinium_carterae.1